MLLEGFGDEEIWNTCLWILKALLVGFYVFGTLVSSNSLVAVVIGGTSGSLYNSFDYVLINIYAPNDISARSTLRADILKLKDHFPAPSCMGGDFNEIRHIGEKGRLLQEGYGDASS